MKIAFGETVTFGRDLYHLQDEMIAWCREQIGVGTWWVLPQPPANMDWCVECTFGRTTFWFKRESDAVLFSLKWL